MRAKGPPCRMRRNGKEETREENWRGKFYLLAQVTQLGGQSGLFDSAKADYLQKSSLHLYHLVNSTQPLR